MATRQGTFLPAKVRNFMSPNNSLGFTRTDFTANEEPTRTRVDNRFNDTLTATQRRAFGPTKSNTETGLTAKSIGERAKEFKSQTE
jgi:hypothetical protein